MNATATKLSEIAEHLGLSRAGARDLEIQGVISRASGLDECRLSYLRHLRARRSHAADDRLRLARAKAIEQKVESEAHKLIPTDEALAVMDAVIGKLVVHLGSVPTRCTRDLELRRAIEAEINRARSAAADECEHQAVTLRSTGRAASPHWP